MKLVIKEGFLLIKNYYNSIYVIKLWGSVELWILKFVIDIRGGDY